jgi:hypothetical protein
MTRLVALTAIVLSLLATSSTAQVSKEELLTPPPGARSYVIISSAGQHGTSASWTLPDGRLASRFSMNLRGQIFEVDETIRLGANGQPENISIRGFTPNGDSAETFEIKDGKARWKNKIEDGGVDYDGKAQYAPYGGTPAANAYFVESLYRAPGKTLTLLPSGTERLVKLVDIPVGTGTTAKTVTAWAVEGVELQPFPVLQTAEGPDRRSCLTESGERGAVRASVPGSGGVHSREDVRRRERDFPGQPDRGDERQDDCRGWSGG